MERESYTNDMFLGTFQSVLVSIRYGGECSIYLCSQGTSYQKTVTVGSDVTTTEGDTKILS